MEYEFEGRTEEEAIEIAANELGLARDEFDVEILESQRGSFLKKGKPALRCMYVSLWAQPKPRVLAKV